jgi:hypothetical protein
METEGGCEGAEGGGEDFGEGHGVGSLKFEVESWKFEDFSFLNLNICPLWAN